MMSEMMIGSVGLSVPEMVIPNGPPYLRSSTVYVMHSSPHSSGGTQYYIITLLHYYSITFITLLQYYIITLLHC